MDENHSVRPTTLPPELTALLAASDGVAQERAWARFLDAHSRLILHTARSLGSEYDAVMDRYTYAIEQLREDQFRRLRSFAADGRGKFTTWLTVVVRRLCLDHYRRRYGRVRESLPDGTPQAVTRAVRRRLADLVTEQVDVARLSAPPPDDPEARVRAGELGHRLAEALGQLPPRDRLLLVMRFEEDLSAREIAEIMGFPTSFHVYRRINALLTSLRRTLQRRGIDDATP